MHLPVASPATAAIASSITLRISVIQNGKRIIPCINVPADKCPDLDSIKQLLPEALAPSFGNSFFKVWLPEGLVPVQNDGEWTIAQLSASAVEWMDGELRVIFDLGNTEDSEEKVLS